MAMRRLICLTLLLCFLAAPAWAKPLAPNEVRVYKFPDFVGSYRSFILPPNKPNLVIPDLGPDWSNKIKSIRSGKDVSVWTFDRTGLEGNDFNRMRPYFWLGIAVTSAKGIPVKPASHTGNVGKRWQNRIKSLLIFPRKYQRPPGAVLLGHPPIGAVMKKSQVFNFSTANLYTSPNVPFRRYAYLPMVLDGHGKIVGFRNMGPFIKGRTVALWLSEGPVNVTLYNEPDFRGQSRRFPGDGSSQRYYNLMLYGMSGRIRSVRLGAEGPMPGLKTVAGAVKPAAPPSDGMKQGYVTGVIKPGPKPGMTTGKVAQPNIGNLLKAQTPQLGGSFTDSQGVKWNFGQKGADIWWRAPQARLFGFGKVQGNSLTTDIAHESNRSNKWQLTGQITRMGSQNRALEIKLSDGNVLKR